MKKSIIINIISWLGISLLLFFYLERQLAFHYFYIEQFRLFRFNQALERMIDSRRLALLMLSGVYSVLTQAPIYSRPP